MRLARVFLVGAIGAVAACSAIAGIGDLVIGECKGGVCVPDTGLPDVPRNEAGAVIPDDSGVPCEGTAPPLGVRIGSPGNTFCIDRTEVSFEHYAAFLAASVRPETQPASCQWNVDFNPDPTDAGPATPAVGIDRCDALAYCTWAGKYLCGVVESGKKVGPVTVETTSDFRANQWLLACSAEARQRYPYGPLYDGAKCNGADYDAGATLPVGSVSTCVGGYAGVYDLIGNAWEFYDGPCLADGTLEVDGGDGGPASDNCWIKGSSYGDRGPGNDCLMDLPGLRRDFRGANVGFRCCSD